MADVMLLLVEREAFDGLCSMPLEQLLDGMQGQALRDRRPEADPRFHRGFDADLEGDVLEWSDGAEGADPSRSLCEQRIPPDSACELADFWRFNVSYMEQIYAEQSPDPP